MLEHTQLKQHDSTVASLDVQLHATDKQNSSTFPRDIGNLLLWRTLGMADQIQQILHELTKAFMDI